MNKIAVVYWSGTGNTETMANLIAEGAKAAGAEAEVIPVVKFSAERLSEFAAIAFGCPSMGAEELEDTEFLPMFESVKDVLGNKPVALFGSYGWGSGEWMDTWKAECETAGIQLAAEPVIANETPDDAASQACRDLGQHLAKVA